MFLLKTLPQQQATAKSSTGTNTYDPSAGVGGFVQDSKSTDSGSSGSSSQGVANSLNESVISGMLLPFAWAFFM